ncbi:MAG: RHS repeat-associated core domain-containing protein, partial [Armatimonadetes bacterium]|nr:RHS repeat-associated core domain-containing protein [Armatimonadota bacterium]
AAPSGTRTCVWDSENRMVSCVYNGNNCAYTYGADGIRRRGVVNGVTTDYVLDNSMFVQELRAGSPIATSLMGPRGPEYRRDDVAGTVRWYLYDGLGSVLGEVDPSGNLTCSRKYDVYGAVRSFTGTQTSKHRFVGALGHPSEDETGLIYMQARYMDPATGRFVSEDPGRNGENWFTYCDANPVGSVDRDGRDSNPLQWLFELLGTTLVAKFLIDKPLTLGLRNLTSWLGWMSRWLIDGGREQMGQGAVEIEIGNEQDFTPSGFSIAGLSLGSGAMDSTFGASRLALGIILQYVVEYMEYMLDMNPDQ